jgi:transposase InsO family protein
MRFSIAFSTTTWGSRTAHCGPRENLARTQARVGTKTQYIERGSPCEHGYCESFNGKLRDECLNEEIFYSLKEAQIVIESWRVEYNTERPLRFCSPEL